MRIRLTRKRLLAAADYMEKHGFNKHTICNDYGEVCALGAIGAAAVGDPWQGYDCVEPANELFKATGGRGNITTWNDRKTRTEEQVVAKLRQMAEMAPVR